MDSIQNLGIVFDGTFEGFLTILYLHYYEKLRPIDIQAEEDFQQMLGTTYVKINTDLNHAMKVFHGIANKISKEICRMVYVVFLSKEDNRHMISYKFLLLAFKMGKNVLQCLHIDEVLSFQKQYKNVSREAMKQTEFCRFAETKEGIYYCPIGPLNNVLPLCAEFFIQRFPTMCFILHDTVRGVAAIYDTKQCIIEEVGHTITIDYSTTEAQFQALWYTFYKSIAIKDRINPKLQRSLLPLRYRKYMTEFQ